MATTGGIDNSDIRDLMIECVERRYALVDKFLQPIQWLSDNGSPYIAGDTRALARYIGLAPCTTRIQSPQSNGMAEAFVKTFKRGLYAGECRARRGQRAAPARFMVRALQQRASTQIAGYRSPREFRKQILEKATGDAVGALRRPNDGTTATEAAVSRPEPPLAAARNASLDASAAVDHP